MTDKPSPTQYFDANGTGYVPQRVCNHTTAYVPSGHSSVWAEVTKKGRGNHHRVRDMVYVDIPTDFIRAHYPDLLRGG